MPRGLPSNSRARTIAFPTADAPVATNAREDGTLAGLTSTVYDDVNNQYRIVLTNYVQQLIAGQLQNNGFIILPDRENATANRAVFGGTTHPSLAPVLRITYTTLPQ